MAANRSIVVLGTSSGVGKTLITLALCRWLRWQGVRVAPFKAMSMQPGHAVYQTTSATACVHYHQAYQAVAAGVRPHHDMNPIAVWGHNGVLIAAVRGRKHDTILSMPAQRRTATAREAIKAGYDHLARHHEFVVAEGCGSPVELNIKHRDVTNLWLAQAIDAPCVLVSSAAQTGVFASLLGTLALMTEPERRRVMGFIVNRYAGDPRDFASGIEILQQRARLPCLGIVPHCRDLDLLADTPSDPDQVRTRVHSRRLDTEIEAWAHHVITHLSLDRLGVR
ncbi:hypothetical protein GCM10012275_56810 [Longimycelium tulufanense]|uniref:CobQ/CobB/MinD/ParA nucleotide binding domain-containing protein n=1 Tax=Longimycelium tulufanense TaxID=907463 RepID=A0A8J3FYU2_9PSEU|nr:AAA family ATPase [Longimycelium tulufanense]GGM78814.1 hypothetical protein GCM10012275_56810 [Longimycelium tulufanense]